MHPLWTVELSQNAARDFDEIVRYTRDNFGIHQAMSYSGLIAHTIQELSERGPDHPLATDRSELLPGIRSIRIQRESQKARHVVFFKAISEMSARKLVVVRILHDSMDFAEHL
ncbi:type II toxin-antitoxin system RelE/ParE family toxin [Marinobacter sp. bablab_jr008]|uniref:type II toxin-antitoxin system RelE/ParE family toxin n=1 Tax=Marinobacter sp. bablab_jr008 TaxID=2755064 RepID=UPI0018F17275|nr:type II toxin-antitoxin system RelE/ParE family toxin [Marinobacter sp. bablab_jr008]MEC9387745.1 type II toxin-antitoxin system RelE/ParE family toxin [Pseudomonadota bacterium]